MNEDAYAAIEKAWIHTIKTRALCPYASESAIGMKRYLSPPWYRERGAEYFVNLAKPLTSNDVRELEQIGTFVNQSFIISMVAILEEYEVVPFRGQVDCSREGGDHVCLTKKLRHKFAHGESEYDANNPDHHRIRQLLEQLFPEASAKEPGFALSIDTILEPLKNGVRSYIRATT